MGDSEPPESVARIVGVYGAAATGFAELVRRIPPDRWAGPGLGEWDLRALVGHTARSLVTVITYLDMPADQVDIASAEQYYLVAAQVAAAEGAGVLERGRRAGAELGENPAAAVDALVGAATAKLDGRGDELIAVLGGSGMRLSDYLPTRVFELAVHGLDIADATGLDFMLPAQVSAMATALGAGIAAAMGHGATVLRALTGRGTLPQPFSVTA